MKCVMVAGKKVNDKVNEYCILRDRQYAVYANYAKANALTVNELFVLDILWFASDGITQTEIIERLSANKQTISAVITRFIKNGYVTLTAKDSDRRNKVIRFTEKGRKYAKKIIPPAADAENLAMADLSEEEMNELVRLTIKFTENMEKRFSAIKEN